MDFGNCRNCKEYKMLVESNLCRNCSDKHDTSSVSNFYKKGLKNADTGIGVSKLEEWFDDSIPFKDYEVVERKWLMEPYCYALISYSKSRDKYWYVLKEPELNSSEEIILDEIEEQIRVQVERRNKGTVGKRVEIEPKLVDRVTKKFFEAYNVRESGEGTFNKIRYYLIRDFNLFNSITGLKMDRDITEIFCSEGKQFVSIEHEKYGEMITTCSIEDSEFESFIRHLASKSSVNGVSSANPRTSFEMDNGSKISLTLGSDNTVYDNKFKIEPEPIETPF